jgi:hypothetical protein
MTNIDGRTGKPKIILHLCADIGSDSYPYKKAGYDVRFVGKNIGVENFNAPDNVYGIFANPVCTEFSIASGFHKTGDHAEGLFLVNHCKRIINQCIQALKFWVIENPASGHLREYLGAPCMVYEPWQFGTPYTKKTALWDSFYKPFPKFTKWGAVPKNPNLYVRPNHGKPSLAFLHKSAKKHLPEFDPFTVSDDMSFRSLCSQGFAQAFFNFNQ